MEVNKDKAKQALQLLNEVRVQGKIRKGTNEVTKSIERNEAKLVLTAADVNPQEIVMHIPTLCDEKNIPYVFVETKADLGAAAGLPVATSAVAIANAGDAAKKLADFVEVLKGSRPKPAKAAEKPVEEKKEASQKKTSAEPAVPEKPKAPRKPRAKPEQKAAPVEQAAPAPETARKKTSAEPTASEKEEPAQVAVAASSS